MKAMKIKDKIKLSYFFMKGKAKTMKLIVYKGFNIDFLKRIDTKPLVDNKISEKLNVIKFNKNTRKELAKALLSLKDDDIVWATYEEYTLIKNIVDDSIEEDDLQLIIFRNNLYPDYYPLLFEINPKLASEIKKHINTDCTDEGSEECQHFLNIYNSLIEVEGVYYGSFYNYEYYNEDIDSSPFYPNNILIENEQAKGEYNIFINENIDTYLRDLAKIKVLKPSVIAIKSTNGLVSKRIQDSLQAYCVKEKIRIIKFNEKLDKDVKIENELIDIVKNDIKIANFKKFRTIKFYKNPDIDKEIVEISQSKLIQEIIYQAKSAYDDSNKNNFRDIFITASTGAGKSLIFQVSAVYLAKKYKKLTIIIEPVKALMQDQKEKLNKNGFARVETFNSDLISQVEKEAVLKKIKDGEVDLLYLSPETLLSYSIETIIGDREIGLLIVDEAHIVTTWGVGFRPDYWYLGGYINKLRNKIQTTVGKERKIYHFPICAFTATAINGGVDDSVSDTIISLYMENPIKYIGYVRRDDISFDISNRVSQKLPKSEYEESKTKDLDEHIKTWLKNGEKTIVYFPYASLATEAFKGVKSFAGITNDKRIGIYTGRNVDELSIEKFNATKRETFTKFKDGTIPIMLATKAFGMGVDVDDVKNVYHYAVTGNLCDYVQEIGRVARKPSMNGVAIMDQYYNDFSFTKVLFGMSQIKQYQIKKVLEGIYDTYKSKNGARSFLISPESFTYIFNGKGVKDEEACINKLKTCLLMLEKDFYDKYNFKVIISRPQSVFTKAFVVIHKNDELKVLNSKYGKYFKFVLKGRYKEHQVDGSLLSDMGDIYSIDLKHIWEEFYPNISFPQFKYWYFNASIQSKDNVNIMSSIRECFSPRQKVNIEARGERLLCDLRDEILSDFEYIGDVLYKEYGKSYFTTEDFSKLIVEKYGMAKARIIANSLFDLVDPNGHCVKHRSNDSSGKTYYSLTNGNFKEYMRRTIIKSSLIGNISQIKESNYSNYISLTNDEKANISLKLLSIFDYITYEVIGGEEPEIFIRLNDPNKIKNIVLGNTFYSNNYVTKAKQKHDRDVKVLLRLFNDLKTNKERWDYIENYFLGYDVLCDSEQKAINNVNISNLIDREHSYSTNQLKKWSNIKNFFDENDIVIIDKLITLGVPIPEYLETTIKKSDLGQNIIMSWPSKNIAICQQDTEENILEIFKELGWYAYRIYDIDYKKIKEVFN